MTERREDDVLVRMNRAKSVTRPIADQLASARFGQDPASNTEKTVSHKMCILERENAVVVAQQMKNLAHSYNFNKEAVDPVHTLGFL